MVLTIFYKRGKGLVAVFGGYNTSTGNPRAIIGKGSITTVVGIFSHTPLFPMESLPVAVAIQSATVVVRKKRRKKREESL